MSQREQLNRASRVNKGNKRVAENPPPLFAGICFLFKTSIVQPSLPKRGNSLPLRVVGVFCSSNSTSSHETPSRALQTSPALHFLPRVAAAGCDVRGVLSFFLPPSSLLPLRAAWPSSRSGGAPVASPCRHGGVENAFYCRSVQGNPSTLDTWQCSRREEYTNARKQLQWGALRLQLPIAL
mmetsp:Transcript_3569/g.8911  ORF Transcript_3569/g.8911 Transcript_3569/m.8911 type:complete len:181 (-) Transcript_3569:1373-1915(-)